MFAEKRRTPKMTIKTQNETLAEVGAELCCIIPPYVLDHLAQSSDDAGYGCYTVSRCQASPSCL